MKSFVAAATTFGLASAIINEKYSHLMALQETWEVENGFSPISMEVDGQQKTYYVAAHFSSPGGSSYKVPSNGRGYIHETPSLDQSNPQYFRPNLLGGSVEYDVDLSQHECGCIAAFYLVSMPGKHENGTYWMETDGWGYCDANKVDGNWCPEFDIMEANKWAWATTPHKCDSPTDKGFYYSCDQGGQCQQDSAISLEWNAYGPGDNYTINTLKPFHVKISFDRSGSQFSKFTTTWTQDGKTKSMSTDCSYLNYMSWDLSNGMGFVVSNWGGDASWLWHDKCSGSCNWPELTISNIKIKTGGNSANNEPENGGYDPALYDFGASCKEGNDKSNCDFFGCDAEHCRWSWAFDDPLQWDSEDAGCRCDKI